MDRIYIPTYKRVDNQITFDNLPDKYKEKTVLVVQEQERSQHKHDCEYLVVGNDIGIAKTRHAIVRHAEKRRFCMYDDDVKFHRRNNKYFGNESDMDTSKRLMTEKDFDNMFELFNTWMDDEQIIQIGNRDAFLPPSGHLYRDITEVISTHMIDGYKLSKFIDEIDWDYAQVGEDSMMTLEFMLHGYKNRRSDLFVKGTSYWSEGGCSEFRDIEFHNNEHMKLVTKYPDWVYIKREVERKNIGVIKDFKFRYKEAYEYATSYNLEQFFS